MSIYKQQKEQIKSQIIETSVLMFKENGYDSVTVNEITMKIGIAKGTFYNFFSSKRDVLMIWSIQQFQKLKTEEFINKEKTVEENLCFLVETVYQMIRNEQKMFCYFIKEMIYSNTADQEFDFAALLHLIISNSKDSDSIQKSNIEVSVNVINSALFYEILKWIQSNKPIDGLGTYLKDIQKVCLFGLYNNKKEDLE